MGNRYFGSCPRIDGIGPAPPISNMITIYSFGTGSPAVIFFCRAERGTPVRR
ncbi:hypothetical protein [Pseudonocardia sp. DLS-67]